LLPLAVRLRPHNAAAKQGGSVGPAVRLRVKQTGGGEAGVGSDANATATTDAPFSAAAAAAPFLFVGAGCSREHESELGGGDEEHESSGSAVVWLGPSGRLVFTVQLLRRRVSANGSPTGDDPSVFLELAPAAHGARPAMPVLSLPIQVAQGPGPGAAAAAAARPDGTGAAGAAWRGSAAAAAAAQKLAAFELLCGAVGAHSCRVYGCGGGREVVVAESPGHLGIGGKVKRRQGPGGCVCLLPLEGRVPHHC
jgi:hypothetical protein